MSNDVNVRMRPQWLLFHLCEEAPLTISQCSHLCEGAPSTVSQCFHLCEGASSPAVLQCFYLCEGAPSPVLQCFYLCEGAPSPVLQCFHLCESALSWIIFLSVLLCTDRVRQIILHRGPEMTSYATVYKIINILNFRLINE